MAEVAFTSALSGAGLTARLLAALPGCCGSKMMERERLGEGEGVEQRNRQESSLDF